jgi:glycosyltransferase involved in cell wall biosynthesis
MRCGVGDYTFALAASLADRGMDIAVATSKSLESRKCTTKVLAEIERWDRFALTQLRKIATMWHADLVHLQFPTQGFGFRWAPNLIPLMAHLSGMKVVRTWHEVPDTRSIPRFALQAAAPGPVIVVRPRFFEQMPAFLRKTISPHRFAFIQSASALPICRWSDEERQSFRTRFVGQRERLVVFFGFIYEAKGVDQLFEVCNPSTDKIVICGRFDESDSYHKVLKRLAESESWSGKVHFAGYLADAEVVQFLSAADAVVLPFRNGGGQWNTSILAAGRQGTFVLTTSLEQTGYDAENNLYCVKPGATTEMAQALQMYGGRRHPVPPVVVDADWQRIADEHISVYEGTLRGAY